jgi:hypothetical protein
MIKVKSEINFICNEKANKKLDSIFSKVSKKDICDIFKKLYKKPQDKKDWIRKNTGCDWIDFSYNEGKLELTTCDFPPVNFFSHLWNISSNLDPNIIIEVTFQSESNDVGAFVFVDGVYTINDDEFEPNEEDFQLIQKRIDELVDKCYDELNQEEHFIIKYKED